MGKLGAWIFWLLMQPINAFIGAWTTAKLWTWFVARDYGVGPSLAAWYGIHAIFGVIISIHLVNLKREDALEEGVTPAMKMVGNTLAYPVGMLLILGLSWLVGHAVRWM